MTPRVSSSLIVKMVSDPFSASGIFLWGDEVAKLLEECNFAFSHEHLLFILQLPFPLLQEIVPNLETSGKSASCMFSGHGVWVSFLQFLKLAARHTLKPINVLYSPDHS